MAKKIEKHDWILTGIVLLLIVNVYGVFFKHDALRLETVKVGGEQNMILANKLYSSTAYKDQQKTTLEQVLASIDQTAPDTTNTTTTTTDTQAGASTIDLAKVKTIKADSYVEGNANARITILEYSDLLCPYCKRQKDSKTIEQLLAKYPNDVNSIFRNYIVHPDAKIIAQAAECAGQLWGKNAFFSYIEKGFDLTDTTVNGLVALGTSLGLNKAKFTTCVNSNSFSAKIDAIAGEGNTLFGVTGTPGNVIIDNEKGTYTLIAGAYPIDAFTAVIDKILAEK